LGTSSIFNGPVKSLLPSDYDDFDDNNSPDELNDESPQGIPFRWQDAKGAMTRYVKGTSTDKGMVMSRFVGASGGSKQLTLSSWSGKLAAINLGRLIQDFRENGVENTLQSLKIDYVGKSAKIVLSELVNLISVDTNSKEDIAARGASNEAISILYNIIVENEGDIESLRRIDEDTFNKVTEVFISEYIFRRMMSDLQSRFEKYETNPKEAVKKEQELKDYIKVKVELRFRELKPQNKDYHSNAITKEINDLFYNCFKAFEDYI
jgi:hypothetical protein